MPSFELRSSQSDVIIDDLDRNDMMTLTTRLPGRDRGWVTRLRDATEDNSVGLSLLGRSLGSNSKNLTQKWKSKILIYGEFGLGLAKRTQTWAFLKD